MIDNREHESRCLDLVFQETRRSHGFAECTPAESRLPYRAYMQLLEYITSFENLTELSLAIRDEQVEMSPIKSHAEAIAIVLTTLLRLRVLKFMFESNTSPSDNDFDSAAAIIKDQPMAKLSVLQFATCIDRKTCPPNQPDPIRGFIDIFRDACSSLRRLRICDFSVAMLSYSKYDMQRNGPNNDRWLKWYIPSLECLYVHWDPEVKNLELFSRETLESVKKLDLTFAHFSHLNLSLINHVSPISGIASFIAPHHMMFKRGSVTYILTFSCISWRICL